MKRNLIERLRAEINRSSKLPDGNYLLNAELVDEVLDTLVEMASVQRAILLGLEGVHNVVLEAQNNLHASCESLEGDPQVPDLVPLQEDVATARTDSTGRAFE